MRVSEIIVEKGIRCKVCGKKFLGNYDIKSFGYCTKCLNMCWEYIVFDGKKYTSDINVIELKN